MTTRTNEISVTPRTRPSMQDGVCTGLHITREDSVALSNAGDPVNVPAGTLITGPLSGGVDMRIGCQVDRRALGLSGEQIAFRTR